MEQNKQEKRSVELLKAFILGLLVVIGTFPENDWTFSPGIDPPLTWLYNHLFIQDFGQALNIVFPHGPLAFFMYPLPETVLPVTLVVCGLKLFLFFNLRILTRHNASQGWLAPF